MIINPRFIFGRRRSNPRMEYAVHYRVAGVMCCGASRGITTTTRANVTCPQCRQAIPTEEKR